MGTRMIFRHANSLKEIDASVMESIICTSINEETVPNKWNWFFQMLTDIVCEGYEWHTDAYMDEFRKRLRHKAEFKNWNYLYVQVFVDTVRYLRRNYRWSAVYHRW